MPASDPLTVPQRTKGRVSHMKKVLRAAAAAPALCGAVVLVAHAQAGVPVGVPVKKK